MDGSAVEREREPSEAGVEGVQCHRGQRRGELQDRGGGVHTPSLMPL